MYNKPLNYIFLFCTALLLAGVAHAQSSVVPAPIQYVVSPETPGPNTQVTIEVQGVGTFIGNSTITWSQNGTVVSQGVGQHDFTFTTGAIGTETQIKVTVNSSTQGTLTNSWTFIPSAVNLVWEADTTVPPLYKGKALYSGGSDVKVVAFPSLAINGSSLPVSSLSFQWTLDGDPLPDQSGLGQNSLTFTGSQLQKEEDVSVDVYYGSTKVGTGSVAIPASDPELVLYDKDPLRGIIFDSALPAGISLDSNELTVQAVPYFFSNSSLANGALTYAWTLNGNDTSGPNSASGELSLVQSGSGSGSATLGVTLQNNDTDKLVQAANAALQIIFGTQSSNSGLFGL
ncbi:MAG TPA: hypothetical protein VMR46_02510 [Candidatus Paceibacterota bacterium]|nr:hypothetical protein [Candidatus Paceibacterota bacterium]